MQPNRVSDLITPRFDGKFLSNSKWKVWYSKMYLLVQKLLLMQAVLYSFVGLHLTNVTILHVLKWNANKHYQYTLVHHNYHYFSKIMWKSWLLCLWIIGLWTSLGIIIYHMDKYTESKFITMVGYMNKPMYTKPTTMFMLLVCSAYTHSFTFWTSPFL